MVQHGLVGGRIPFGVQYNTCITEFSSFNGGTCFKVGSRDLLRPPPFEWGVKTVGPVDPYAGEEATQFQCPPDSVILYDSRTW